MMPRTVQFNANTTKAAPNSTNSRSRVRTQKRKKNNARVNDAIARAPHTKTFMANAPSLHLRDKAVGQQHQGIPVLRACALWTDPALPRERPDPRTAGCC